MTPATRSINTYKLSESFKAVDALCSLFVEEVSDELARKFEMNDSQLERVENDPRPGFFPFTEGGWMSMPHGYLSTNHGMGNGCGLLQKRIDREEALIRQDFMADYPDKGDPYELVDESDLDLFYEYENEGLARVFYISVRVLYFASDNSRNRSGRDEVYFNVSINFDENGLDRHGVTLWETERTIEDITEGGIDFLIEDAICDSEDLEPKTNL